jgi:mono/diheme cytochrome c family protein
MRLLSAVLAVALMGGCGAREDAPSVEETAVSRAKELAIGGKDWTNPVPDSQEAVREGAKHFQHHCQVCHGLDGQNTGVPFAAKMDPPVADLASKRVQDYKDGQLKWIIQNGIRFTGMPAWKDVMDDTTMWHIVRYIRHLPAKGSLGAPSVYREGSGQVHSKGEQKPPPGHSH